MDQALTWLVVACAAFVGSHILLSSGLRAPLIRGLGEKTYLSVYSLVAFATIGWVATAFHATPVGQPMWNGWAGLPWVIASLLTILAMALVAGSFNRNPALPQANIAGLSTRKPWGVFRVTRHPMMMGIAIWAIAHIIVAPTQRTILLALAVLMLAVIGSALQDRRKVLANEREWSVWMMRTNFWPDPTQLGAIGSGWVVALVVWFGITALHWGLAGIPAGVWRWLH